MNHRQTLQYLCGLCNTVLKESDYLIDPNRVSEPCPNCGHPLSSTTLTINRPRRPAEQVTFQTAHRIKALTFDVKPLDNFYHGIRAGDAFFITGHVNSLLVSRLCVRSLLPLRLGGLESNVLVIDAGNTSDVYQCVSFARQYGMDISKVLEGIAVSRAFTIHQLAALVITELPAAVKRFGARMVVISGLLTMFLQDPVVDRQEAERLLRQMMMAIKRISEHVIVIVAAQDVCGYEDILAKFQNRIEISGSGTRAHVALSSPYRSKAFMMPEKALTTTGA